MFDHAPPSYARPFCAVVAGVERAGVITTREGVVLRADAVVGTPATGCTP